VTKPLDPVVTFYLTGVCCKGSFRISVESKLRKDVSESHHKKTCLNHTTRNLCHVGVGVQPRELREVSRMKLTMSQAQSQITYATGRSIT
jgi:hypothetical protein